MNWYRLETPLISTLNDEAYEPPKQILTAHMRKISSQTLLTSSSNQGKQGLIHVLLKILYKHNRTSKLACNYRESTTEPSTSMFFLDD